MRFRVPLWSFIFLSVVTITLSRELNKKEELKLMEETKKWTNAPKPEKITNGTVQVKNCVRVYNFKYIATDESVCRVKMVKTDSGTSHKWKCRTNVESDDEISEDEMIDEDDLTPDNKNKGAHNNKTRPGDQKKGAHDHKTRPEDEKKGAGDSKMRPEDQKKGAHDHKTRPEDQKKGADDNMMRPGDQKKGAHDNMMRPEDQKKGADDNMMRPGDQKLDGGKGNGNNKIGLFGWLKNLIKRVTRTRLKIIHVGS